MSSSTPPPNTADATSAASVTGTTNVAANRSVSTSNSNVNAQQNNGNNASRGSNSRNNGDRRGDRDRGNNRNQSAMDTSNKNFEGAEPEIGCVLGLRYERIDKKVTFEIFREKMSNFIERKMEYGNEISGIVKTYEDVLKTFKKDGLPEKLTGDDADDTMLIAIQKEEISLYVKKKAKMASHIKSIYAKIWGQCSEALQNMIKYLKDYEPNEKKKDVQWLLEELNKITTGIDTFSNKHLTLLNAIKSFVNMKQGQQESDDSFLKRTKAMVETLKLAGGGHILYSPQLSTALSPHSPSEDEKREEVDRMCAVHLLQAADPHRYRSLNEELLHASYVGRNEYPTTPANAYELLVRRSGRFHGLSHNAHHRERDRDRNDNSHRNNHTQFLQTTNTEDTPSTSCPPTSDLVPGRDGTTCQLECYYCHCWGHTSNNCPRLTVERTRNPRPNTNGGRGRGGRSGTGLMMIGAGFTQGEGAAIPKNWILLDTCSTCSVSNNRDFLGPISKCTPDNVLMVFTNGGSKTFDETALLKLLPMTIHHNPDSMATILSVKDVGNIPGVQITMDTLKEKAIIVKHDNNIFKFKECKDGLYYYDTAQDKVNYDVTNYSFLETVADNSKFFSADEIKGAMRARQTQQEINWPSTSDFKYYVSKNCIRNSPVTLDDINRAEVIYGPAKPLLEGKMVRRRPPKHRIERVPLPLAISTHHKELQLYIDFFYVNGYPFLASKTSKINFITATPMKSRSTNTIIDAIDDVLNIYTSRGFKITIIHGDNEFNIKLLKDSLLPISVMIYGRNEHVGIIERCIRVLKERGRCTCHSIPYHYYTKLMIQSLIATVVKWLNAFPSKNGISKTMSPSNIVEGKPNPDFNNKRIVFGSYALVYIDTDNTMNARSVPAIALEESNDDGGYYFMNLYTGKRLHSYQWTELPIDEDVIAMVQSLAEKENKKGPVIKEKYPLFEWSPGVPIVDVLDAPTNATNNNNDDNNENEDDDENNEENGNDDTAREQAIPNDAIPLLDEEVEYEEDPALIANANETDNIYVTDNENEQDIRDNEEIDQHDDDSLMDDPHNDLGIDQEEMSNSVDTEERIEDSVETEERVHDDNGDTQSMENEERAEPPLQATMRPVRRNAGTGIDRLEMSFAGKMYSHSKHKQFLMFKAKYDNQNDMNNFQAAAHNVMFTQMNAKKGIKQFGERAVAAIFKEFRQMDKGPMPGKPVFGPQDASKMTPLEKKKTLEAVNLVKEKRDGSIKGRTCADGSRQKQYLKPDESVYSPTVSPEALIATLIVDAKEERDVAIYDIPGAYLQTELPDDTVIHMKLRGDFVDIMCEVNPDYLPYVIYENGQKVLYVKILRAIYGCIESALLWYNLYVTTLKGMGFTINTYDKCVANKIINGKQCTIVWYVDDNKVSHKDPAVVTEILNEIKKHFGDITISRGKEHEFLGMDIKLRGDGLIEVCMKKQIEEAAKMFGDLCSYKVTSPCANHLWDVNEKAELLSEEKAATFHSVTAKLLHLSKRPRPDIEPAIAFCTTRVQQPSVDDWKKLRRCVSWLMQTIDDKRIIGCFNLYELFTWVDASFAVHPNMRSHTGGVMSMGFGMIHCRSSKQKLNAKSSTEAELIGTSEYVPFNIWFVMFMKEQGHEIKVNILFQDNESTVRMLKNGRDSCTGNSRHIDIKHFFVKDRIDKKEIEVRWCPTHLMIADYFTKPLQGKQFRLFRDLIMGYMHINDFLKEIDRSIKERVEKQKKVRFVSERSNLNNGKKSWADVVKIQQQPHNKDNEKEVMDRKS